MKEETNARKPILLAGIGILTISLCVIFPFEYSRTNYISELPFTFLTLALSMLILMYGVMGKHFFKGLIFLLCSCFFSFIAWLLLYPSEWFSMLVAFWAGIPSGIIAGLIFMLVNYQFISVKNRYHLFFTRLISYIIILSVVSILFHKGGDWIFDISEYFKSK